ncbi:Zn-ribbon domain-containing OB-fold protein [Bacillus sp. JJ1562]|uniref:Zn-ribbon domain-containing OB-fold protein n=1 Tax=Bacillus sp. JJ1562 TaxID=3122960 RepID=UPI00300109B8
MYNLEKLIVADSQDDHLKLNCSQCPKCERKYFPLKEICADCLESLTNIEISSYGRIFSYTTIQTDSPLYKAPYTLAFVDLDDGVRLLARVNDENQQLSSDQRVKAVRTTFTTKSGETINSFEFKLI